MSETEKQIDWSEPSPPNKYCPYDHVFMDTPLGRLQIEWKSWKISDSYCLLLNDNYIFSDTNLDQAKEHGLQVIKDKTKELNDWLISKNI